MATPQETRMRDTFLRTIAVVGLVAVLLLGAWGIIQLAVALPSLFGSLGSGSSITGAKETVTLSAPASVQSGQSLTVSWNHQGGSGDYSYSLSYACQSGVSLKAPLPTGSYQTIQCNTPFNFVNATSKMTVIPTLSGSQPATLALTVSATKLSTGAISANGSANVTVTSSAANTSSGTSAGTQPKPTSTYTSAPATTYYPAPTRAALYGYPDLAVTILSATPDSSFTNVRFQIQNVGTNVVRSGWNFNASLPIDGGYTFQSQPQQTLYPGDKIVYTLSFSNDYSQYPYNYNYGYGYGYPGQYITCNMYGPCNVPGYPTSGYGYNSGNYYYGGPITITVDPYNQLIELNKTNNTATIGNQGW